MASPGPTTDRCWETNTISFSTSTNPTAIVVRGLNPYNPADTNAPNNLNAVVDDFVLSALVTNTIDGLLHFTEDTNLAVLPIKFAPTPVHRLELPARPHLLERLQQRRAGPL